MLVSPPSLIPAAAQDGLSETVVWLAQNRVIRGVVRHDQNEYRLFTQIWENGPGDVKVLFSTDGANWSDCGEGSLFSWSQSAGDYNGRISELKTEDTYRLYTDGGSLYDTNNFMNNHSGIRLEYATTTNPLSYESRQTIADDPGGNNQTKLYEPWAVAGLGGDHLYFNANLVSQGGFGNGEIVHSWYLNDTAQMEQLRVVIPRGSAGSFDDQKVEKPVVFFSGQRYEMFYAATSSQEIDGSYSHLGYAASEDGQSLAGSMDRRMYGQWRAWSRTTMAPMESGTRNPACRGSASLPCR